MYGRSHVNNNIGRRSYGNYPGPQPWMSQAWGVSPNPPRGRETTDSRSSLSKEMEDKFVTKTENEPQVLRLVELSTSQQRTEAELARLTESVGNLEQTLINNENLVNMQNYLYQANMTIAKMVQEMITTYFNQTPKVDTNFDSDRGIPENSHSLLQTVRQTLEKVSEQSKEIQNQSEQLNNLATSESVNLPSGETVEVSSNISSEVDSDSEHDNDNKVVDVTTN